MNLCVNGCLAMSRMTASAWLLVVLGSGILAENQYCDWNSVHRVSMLPSQALRLANISIAERLATVRSIVLAFEIHPELDAYSEGRSTKVQTWPTATDYQFLSEQQPNAVMDKCVESFI